MFRNAIDRQRCIVPADAFYEWAPATPADPVRRKQPWCFRTAAGSGLLLMGGLWERWQPRGAELCDASVHLHDPHDRRERARRAASTTACRC